jgi:hypothetical protein
MTFLLKLSLKQKSTFHCILDIKYNVVTKIDFLKYIIHWISLWGNNMDKMFRMCLFNEKHIVYLIW